MQSKYSLHYPSIKLYFKYKSVEILNMIVSEIQNKLLNRYNDIVIVLKEGKRGTLICTN